MASTLASTDIFFGGENSGLRKVTVSPVVIFNVLDHYIRRSEGRARVIGTLLGRRAPDGTVEVRTSFPLPHSEGSDNVAVDTEYNRTMYQLLRKTSASEELVGWYATGADTDMNSMIIHEYYGRECPMPVHLLIDAGLQSNRFNIGAYVSTSYTIRDRALSSEFRPIPVHVRPDKADKVGLDVLFKNKRRMEAAPAANSPEVVMASEIDNLEKSLERLLELLDLVGKNVDAVVAGEIEGDITAGRYLAETLTMVPKMNSSDFERLFGDNMRDLLMVSYLCKLTNSQLIIGERLLGIDIGTNK